MKLQTVMRSVGAALFGFVFVTAAQAHFLWLTSAKEEGQTKAILYFSESAHKQDYHLPEAMVDAKVWQRLDGKALNELEMEQVDTEDRVGLEAKLGSDSNCTLATKCDYGIYGGSLLSYYTKHVRSANIKELGKGELIEDLKIEIVPRMIDGKIELSVTWEGKPKAKIDVSVFESNEKSHKLKTNAEGKASFVPTVAGLVGVMSGFTDRSSQGELAGKEYVGAAHYATLTFEIPSLDGFEQMETASTESSEPEVESEFPLLPAGLASFGGAVHEGWLYIYGGHIGGAHEHSRDNLSPYFQRLRIDGGEAWELLPMQTPLQGLALVAHKSGLYRVGGLNARNAEDEDEDLHSTTEFAQYDPANKKWTKLADLPEPRSSHDAVVIGDKLYVAGGWTLAGAGSDGQWLDTALVFDLSQPDGQWETLPKAPFRRRALAVSHWQSKLMVLGGIDEDGDISFDVNCFDPETREWTVCTQFPGQGMDGFGVSAWNLNGKLYACGLAGCIQELAEDGSSWSEAVKLKTPRFFHQLLPQDDSSLIAVAGASSSGHLNYLERVPLEVSESD